jgi:thiol:disulfide interchange protein
MAFVAQGARIADPLSSEAARTTESGWEPFSQERLSALRVEGRPIFIDFTADWCLSCKMNERIALDTDAARTAFAEAGVTLLVADWTNRDPLIAEAIEGKGRVGIPLYVMYSGDPTVPAEILPAVLTPGLLTEAVGRAAGS